MAVVYINGEWFSKDDAKISVYDHGLLYGDGLFEGIRIYGGKIFRLEDHIHRLYQGAGVLMLDIPMDRDDIAAMLEEGVRRFFMDTGLNDGYIRLVVTRGKGDLGIDPAKCSVPTVISIFDTIQLYPRELYEKGISLVTASSRRIDGSVFDPRVKSLNYLNNIFAKQEAKLSGCMEAVLLNREGYVTECTADNIFLVFGSVVKTPASYLGILEGITRKTVMEAASDNGIPVEEAVMTRFDLYTADECFITGSGAELMPVIGIDGRTIGSGKPGKVTAILTETFRRKTESGIK